MATTTDLDLDLLHNCLEGHPRAWEDFVDRFMGLVLHVIDEVAATCGGKLNDKQRQVLCEQAFAKFHANNYAELRKFEGTSRFASYLSVLTRRAVIDCLSGADPTKAN